MGTMDNVARLNELMTPELMANMWILGVIVVALVLLSLCIMGILTHKLAKKKGYKGYFWTGFFLQLVGLIYVVGLPEKHRHSARHSRTSE